MVKTLNKQLLIILFGLTGQLSVIRGTPRMRVAAIPLNNPHLKGDPEKIRLFGLVRLDTAWTSRQGLGFIANGLWLYPSPYYPDKNGCDINACNEFIMTPANSMLGADIGTFSIGRADLTGRILGAFSGLGLGTAGLFAIAQAYVQVDWPKTRLVIGNDFHPFTSKVTTPNVVAINAGAPFAPFSQVPQIRLTKKFGNFSLSPTIWTEFVYDSDGPDTLSTNYILNSGLPGFNLMLEYESDRTAWGIGVDAKKLRPLLYKNTDGGKYVNPGTVTSFITSTYVNLQFERFAALAQICGGQNGADLLLPGGYAVACQRKETTWVGTFTGNEGYCNTYFFSLWAEVDVKTNSRFKPGAFVGYSKNFGTRHKELPQIPIDPAAPIKPCTQPVVYSLDRLTAMDPVTGNVNENLIKRVDRAIRFDGYVRYLFSPIELGLECEVERAVFGLYNKKAQVVQQCPETYLQLMAIASYYF